MQPIQKKDPDYPEKLEAEIPQFLHFLLHRKLSTSNKSRMWFTPEQIYTEALRKVKAQYVNMEEKELYEVIKEIMEIKELDSLAFINSNIKALLDRTGYKVSRSKVRSIIEDKWGLSQYPNASNFTTYQIDHGGILFELKSKGRYYTITKAKMEEIKVAMFT